MSPASHLVQILLPTRTGTGQPVTQARFEELLQELTDKFGGATSLAELKRQAANTLVYKRHQTGRVT